MKKSILTTLTLLSLAGCQNTHRTVDRNSAISNQCKLMTEFPSSYLYRCQYNNEICFVNEFLGNSSISCLAKPLNK